MLADPQSTEHIKSVNFDATVFKFFLGLATGDEIVVLDVAFLLLHLVLLIETHWVVLVQFGSLELSWHFNVFFKARQRVLLLNLPVFNYLNLLVVDNRHFLTSVQVKHRVLPPPRNIIFFHNSFEMALHYHFFLVFLYFLDVLSCHDLIVK